jgi:parvulin-like peptidyl-prolyl isomerase
MRSFKLISRGMAAVLLMAAVASAQLMNGKSFDVIRVENVGISGGKIDSLAQMLGAQQFRGKNLTDEMMTQLRYAVIDNLVGQELVKLECKKQGIKVPASRIDSAVALFKAQVGGEKIFQEELKKSNTSMAQFRAKVEDQLKTEVLLEKKVPYPKDPTEDEIKAYWTLNKSKISVNDSVGGIRIYKKTKGMSAQEVADVKDMLKGLAAQLRSQMRTQSKKGAFAAYNFATQYFAQQAIQGSDDPDAKKTGGVLLTTLKGNGSGFEKAVSKLKVGEISDVYQDKDGVSIFMLTGKNDGKLESFRYQIEALLRMKAEQDRQMQLKAYLDGLGKVYKVQYLDKKYTPPEAIGAK